MFAKVEGIAPERLLLFSRLIRMVIYKLLATKSNSKNPKYKPCVRTRILQFDLQVLKAFQAV